jgi:hypothetical protein
MQRLELQANLNKALSVRWSASTAAHVPSDLIYLFGPVPARTLAFS